MKNTWTYRNFEIKEGLKPGSKTFRYFFRVFEEGEKRCNLCVWITDDVLHRFDPSGDFNAIADSRKDDWHRWIREKIDSGDYRNRALKYNAAGEQEINLSDMQAHVTVE